MNIKKDPKEMKFRITQDYIRDMYLKHIHDEYYQKWGFDENKNPIKSSTYYFTYRIEDQKNPAAPMLDRFRGFMGAHLKWLRGNKKWSVKHICEFQPVGMAAVDFNGSAFGRKVDEIGPHVHGVLVVHPEFKHWTIPYLQLQNVIHDDDFWIRRPREDGRSMRDWIDYSLKGIMHEKGFYKGRDQLSIHIGARTDELKSNVVMAGRKAGSRQPLFKLRSD